MTCFDTKFNIVKYKTIGDILEEFVNTRLPLYETRRLCILETLTRQIEELDAKRRFIQAILDGKLELQRKTDEQIVEGLKSCNIPALSNPSAPDAYDSYDYVTKMRIDKVKQSAIIEMDKHIVEKKVEIERLENETAQSLWLSDLNDFEEAWKVYSQHRTDEQTAIAKSDSNSGTTKAPRKRTKPSVALNA
jgi:DNA topoisomerase-2